MSPDVGSLLGLQKRRAAGCEGRFFGFPLRFVLLIS